MEVISYQYILKEYNCFINVQDDTFMDKLCTLLANQARYKKRHTNVSIDTNMINFNTYKNKIFLNINKLSAFNYDTIIEKLKNEPYNNNQQVPKFILAKILNSKNDHDIIIKMLLDIKNLWTTYCFYGYISVLDYIIFQIQKLFEQHNLLNRTNYHNIINFMCCLYHHNIMCDTVIRQCGHYLIQKHNDVDNAIFMLHSCNFEDNNELFKILYMDKTLNTKTLFRLEEYMQQDSYNINNIQINDNYLNLIDSITNTIEEFLNHNELEELFLTIHTFTNDPKIISYGILISYISNMIDLECLNIIINYASDNGININWKFNSLMFTQESDLLVDYPNSHSLLEHVL